MRIENDSYFLHNEACPKCQENGWDIPGDNLAVWSDGRVSCWACGFFRLPKFNINRGVHKPTKQPLIKLPDDSDTNYPDKAIKWMGKYELTQSDMLKNRLLWSDNGCCINLKGEKVECEELLLFPIWGDGELLGWQGRYFGHDERVPKWIGRGKLNEVFNIFPGKEPLILVEAVISAIKVNKVSGYSTMPLYGMNAKSRWDRLRLMGHSRVVLWLDPGMGMENLKQARVGSLKGLQIHSLIGEKKPKDYTRDEILSLLNGSGGHVTS